jgi:hypothetical protein
MTATDIDQEEAIWIKSYAEETVKAFRGDFDAAGNRFKNGKKLLERFTGAIDIMLAKERSFISGVDEAHNELCIATQLLANSNPNFKLLEYEPAMTGGDKTIDFRATADDGCEFYVDVKTIKPQPRDRWDQFEKAMREGWFPEHVRVALSKGWLGGELWHNMFAARYRMLEYTLELEAKIRDYKLDSDKAAYILALGGEGFHWRQDELEDFVAFYRTGKHRPDDPFSQAEAKYIADKGIRLDGTITQFACMNRPQFEIRHRRLNWNVRPPGPPVIKE